MSGTIRTYRFPAIDRVVHGVGSIARVPRIVEELGARRAFVVTGRSVASKTPLVRELEGALGNRHAGTFGEMGQHAPKSDIDRAVALAQSSGADCLIGIGGSSVTDATKIIAVQLLGTDEPQRAMPQILVPTTLSAGEYTPASGMTGDVAGVKTYVVDPRMAPFAVVLDPAATVFTPSPLWLSTGVKTIDHACEMIWGPRAHPVTTTLALEALRLMRENLPITQKFPTDLGARLQCQIAGWMSMSGVSNVQVYLSHTLGHQIGARWDVPHGLTSGITLPVVMRALHDETPNAMPMIALALGVDVLNLSTLEACDAGAFALEQFVESLGLPTRLHEVGADRNDIPAVARATFDAGRATGFGGSFDVTRIEMLLNAMW